MGLRGDRNDQGAETSGLERHGSGQTAIGDDTEGVEVGPVVDLFVTKGLFRAHVVRCSHQVTRAGLMGLSAERRRFGDAEVQHLDDDALFVVLREEEVLGFDVAMDDAELVGLGEALGCVRDDAREQGDRQHRFLLQAVCEGLAPEHLHGDVGTTGFVNTMIDDAHDVGTVDPCGRLGFLFETGAEVFTGRELGPDELDGDPNIQRGVPSRPHAAHRAASEGLFEPKTPSDEPSRNDRCSFFRHA